MSNNLPPYLTISQDISADLAEAISVIQPDKIAILIDENTKKHCLPLIDIRHEEIIEIKSGETEKTLETCNQIWSKLTDGGFTRKSLLVNLGGGVIGDMGGFAAATFKRGMPFINVPTTLLSQVDASIGGKLGVDFNGLKNHIGLFQDPNKVIIHTSFLNTLSERELKSGFAEIIKHSLIKSQEQWNYLLSRSFESIQWDEVIPKSIAIKSTVVDADPREKGLRKILNYGHTIGHALETHYLKSETPLLHGEAVALGMILENEIAERMGMLNNEAKTEIKKYLENIYQFPKMLPGYEELAKHLSQDKKNDQKGLRFSLLEKVGMCTYDVLVDESILKDILR
ncbi:3-dehydroquinate synthase [Ekhidna sp.]|uniref:3-dehydroquinate synthase n=1 Tax=Ekhidna sp. TaxID=2608089 RepID=UPI00351829F8